MLFLAERIAESVEILRMYEPPEGYYLAFSGGKDSVVLHELARYAGVKFDAHYHVTSADQPELVRFIRSEFSDVAHDRPDWTMWNLIPHKQWPPTRVQRYCCQFLKESGGEGRVVLTGIKKTDSRSRRDRIVQSCEQKGTTTIAPLLHWCDDEIWWAIKEYKLPYSELYDEGYKRLGCIGCPLAGPEQQKREFERWPKFRSAYVRAFDRMLKVRAEHGKESPWANGEEVMSWWLKEDAQ